MKTPRPLPLFLRPEYLGRRRKRTRGLEEAGWLRAYLQRISEIAAEETMREEKGLPPKRYWLVPAKRLRLRRR
jgi:hypothetical protein